VDVSQLDVRVTKLRPRRLQVTFGVARVSLTRQRYLISQFTYSRVDLVEGLELFAVLHELCSGGMVNVSQPHSQPYERIQTLSILALATFFKPHHR
jgi:hypothetical protein